MEKVLWVIIVIMLSDLERHGERALFDVVIVLSDLDRHGEVGLFGQQRAWTAEGHNGGLRSDRRGPVPPVCHLEALRADHHR